MGSVGRAVGAAVSSLVSLAVPVGIGAGIAYLKGWNPVKGAIWGGLVGIGLSVVLGLGVVGLLAYLASRADRSRLPQLPVSGPAVPAPVG
jgi:hypothetical protein